MPPHDPRGCRCDVYPRYTYRCTYQANTSCRPARTLHPLDIGPAFVEILTRHEATPTTGTRPSGPSRTRTDLRLLGWWVVVNEQHGRVVSQAGFGELEDAFAEVSNGLLSGQVLQ